MKTRKLLALTLALVMAMALMIPAFADDPPVGPAITVNYGTSLETDIAGLFPDVTFTYGIATTSAPTGGADKVTFTPAAAEDTVTGFATGGAADLTRSVTDDGTFGIQFAADAPIGEYRFTITQTAIDTAGVAKKDTETGTRLIQVLVANALVDGVPTGAIEVVGVSVITVEEAGEDPAVKDDNFTWEDGILTINSLFANAYDADNAATYLTLKKQVAGAYARLDDEFAFTVAITDTNAGVVYDLYNAEGLVSENNAFPAGGAFTLKHNEYVVLKGLSAAATAVITEAADDEYIASYAITDGATATNAATDNALATPAVEEDGDHLVAGDTVVFTNTFAGEEPPTGVLLSILPYALMVVLAAVAVAFFLVMRKRRVED